MKSNRQSGVSRRTYLKLAGASSVAGLTVTAGCTVDTGGDGENGGGSDGGDDGSGNDTGTDGGDGGNTEIVPGTAPGFPPFEFKDEQGELVGFDIDLLEAVVEETDYTLADWEEFEFDSLIPALQNDRIDVIAAAMTITEDRQETIAFSDPYYNADQSILVAGGSDFDPQSLDDLAGQTVGAQEGTTGAGVVESELVEPGDVDQSNFRTYGNYVLAVQDLENGNVDALVIDQPVAQTFADQRDVEIAFVYETGERYGFGLRQNESDVQSALNEGLQAVRDSGQYEEIRNEWFGGSGGETSGNESSGNESGNSSNSSAVGE
ncbi:basic amino acid ABC transporter substrate-binding protein [Haloprofundus sp. MHR1]|uniref:basic amino acid ABC transporter substrate-binding protein n=1 Tax=Haloprofundus sp. MHR1 TaxID=2572921 RepID=UPI0010BF22DC|nr:basic amino acid ABC transporter substrate-binding protein [Haloprofundus sp. MHR1]QCJ46367.1 basic amino acid ABC transporter substrate-binding protein [Haloprofundus sp. MHR1]